ncbi:MAG: Uma2 family endonuclease [Microscillaceae bacterium]|nr:Uma2 family endonuclease [Microscillaceae bacterium]
MTVEELIHKINQLSEEEQLWIAGMVEKLLADEISIDDEDAENTLPQSLNGSIPLVPAGALYPFKLSYDLEDILAIVAQFPKGKKWTFVDLQDERIFPKETTIKIEIINHKIFIMPKPTLTHQEIAMNVATFINLYVIKNKLGKVYAPPISVKLEDAHVVEPDVLVILMPKLSDLVANDKAIEGAPDLVVEVISKANYKKLRNLKKQVYAEFGVQEYWEVFPKKKRISVECLQTNEEGNAEYVLFSEANQAGTIKSSVLEGFELNVADIFGI